MKKVIFVFTVLMIIISCKSNKSVVVDNSEKEANYIPYYLKVYEAKDLYETNKYEECYNLLDGLFIKYKPIETYFVNELDLYCKVANKLKKYQNLKRILLIMVKDYGYCPYLYENYDAPEEWKEIVINSGCSEAELKSVYEEYLKNINYQLKDTISVMLKRDQQYRNLEVNKTVWSKLDSIDSINAPLLLNILKKYGYPREKLIGGMELENHVSPSFFSIMLKHVNYQFCLSEVQPILYEELKKGKCHPWIYAGMLDHLKIVLKLETPFPYYGTYENGYVQDSTQVNMARATIGLPKLKYQKRINNH